jgi:hypothetical protein
MGNVSTDAAGPRPRANGEETAPFPLEFMVMARKRRASQDETAPFPLEFQIASPSQEETSPFLLEFMVVRPDGEAVPAHFPWIRRRTRIGAPPELRWRGEDTSLELRRYAAKIESGEKLPPFEGPVLASGEFPQVAPVSDKFSPADAASRGEKLPPLEEPAPVSSTSPAVAPAPAARSARARQTVAAPTRTRQTLARPARASQSMTGVKVVLGVLALAAVLASALLGDDAQLRSAGQSIQLWFTGDDSSFQTFPAASPVSEP